MLVSHNAWVVEENLDKLRLLNQKKTTLLNILGIEIQEISLPGFTLVFSSSLIKGFNWQKRPRSVQCDFGYGLPHDQWIIFLASTQGKIVLDSTPLVLYRQHGENKCGLPAKADLMKDLRHSRQAGCKSYLQRAEILFEWVECLNALSLSSPKIYEKNLREAAEYWQKMWSMYIRRSDIYSDKSSFVDRINPLLELLLSGMYWNKKGGLGIKALLKDAAHTVGLLKIK